MRNRLHGGADQRPQEPQLVLSRHATHHLVQLSGSSFRFVSGPQYGHDTIHLAQGAEHEQEAWLYSAIVCGILVGCHSVWCRAHPNGNMPDEGYLLA